MSVQAQFVMENDNFDSEQLSAIVKAETAEGVWSEIVDVLSVSATGASFNVKQECQVGRLVSLVLPLEPVLRSYDHGEELYAVLGLVQHCHRLAGTDQEGYQVGVAFIGKHAPESYREDPLRSYRICGMSEDGLWKIKEADSDFKSRKDARYFKSIDLYLALIDAKKSPLAGERTTTENISRSGASVISNLELNVGDRVKFISEEYDFSGLAVVCNRKIGIDDRPRLHLRFVENMFPIETISMPHSEAREERTYGG